MLSVLPQKSFHIDSRSNTGLGKTLLSLGMLYIYFTAYCFPQIISSLTWIRSLPCPSNAWGTQCVLVRIPLHLFKCEQSNCQEELTKLVVLFTSNLFPIPGLWPISASQMIPPSCFVFHESFFVNLKQHAVVTCTPFIYQQLNTLQQSKSLRTNENYEVQIRYFI